MPEAVIVATGRTPIGRANKGSLVECRPDDLSALVIGAVLEKLPQLDPNLVEDVLLVCGQPAGEAPRGVGELAEGDRLGREHGDTVGCRARRLQEDTTQVHAPGGYVRCVPEPPFVWFSDAASGKCYREWQNRGRSLKDRAVGVVI